ncbi:hypothetical protein N7466_007127 [Penicillium verhagenii]|uniref:uncharacterized protein n=1 Tax=Penicillium verhagenii TaxID=1562060 RepID=UPI0025451639|nr:uncharacterized protein N7466_007127 [Penicillium verhagenii]KAJ5928171.1 hypothetical protein N7466_007127 [Penicillium verhagenii]
MASSSTSASAQPSSSAASAPATSTFGPPLPEHISSDLPGDLNALPLELVWTIFDQLFMPDPTRLTHKGFCSLRKLALTNKSVAAHIEAYLNKKKTANNIKSIVREIKWWNWDTIMGIMEDNGTKIDDPECDVITGTIIDDCPDCFMCLQKMIPELDGTGVSQNGWTFVALAAYHASLKILNFFFTSKPYYGPCIHLLARWANVFRGRRYNTLSVITKQGNLQFLRALFTFLGPLGVRQFNYPGPFGVPLQIEDMYHLCGFATPKMAKHWRKFGIPLHLIRNGTDRLNAYHAAAATNSIDFLDYLYEISPLDMNQRDNEGQTPLHFAISANRLDVVLWFIEHGAQENNTDRRSLINAGHLAAKPTTEQSEKMLEAVLPSAESALLKPISCGTMIGRMLNHLRKFIMESAVNSNLSIEEYASLRQLHEERALRKCHLIFNASTLGCVPIGHENLNVGGQNFHRPGCRHMLVAKNIARSLGFESVLGVISKYYG